MSERPIRILVLEDDPDMREMLAMVLEDQGYQVTAVDRGEQALEQAAAQPFDLFVADIRMEGMSGLEAIEAAREHQPDLGSLVVSGWASEEETLEAVRLNVGGYLKKPFAMADFLARVQELLARRLEQRRKDEQEALLQRAVLWSLGSLSRVADESTLLAPRGALQRAGSLAARLARACRLPHRVVEQVRVGAMVAGLSTLTDGRPPRELEESQLLEPLFSLLRHARERFEDRPDMPLPGRIGGLVLEAGLIDPSEELPSAAQLESRLPGRFDPELLKLYDSVRQQPQEAPTPSPEVLAGLADPERLQRSLLSLGRTLERSGDRDSAREAYRQVVEAGPFTRPAVAACLGLAGLAASREEGVTWALRAPREARALGPGAFGTAALESGVLLLAWGDERAGEALRLAHQALSEVGLAGPQALATVALARVEPVEGLAAAIESLSRPARWSEVAGAADWLVPNLLELRGEEAWWERADRLVLQFPNLLGRLIEELSPRAQTALARALETAGEHASLEVVDLLVQRGSAELRARAVALREKLLGRPAPPLLRLDSLGFFEVHLGEAKVDERRWRTQKTRFLLAYLAAARPGEPVHDERIVDEFWPEARTKGRQNLWAATSALRRALKLPQGSPDVEFVIREGETLSLNWELPRWHDLEELEKALDGAEQGDSVEAARLYQEAMHLYAGPFLDGCFMEWAVRRRGHLEERMATGLCRGARLCADSGRYSEALEFARRALDLDSLHLEAHLLKMRGHLGLGQPAATIQHFEACSQLLKRELDLEPTTELIEVYTRARHGLGDAAQR